MIATPFSRYRCDYEQTDMTISRKQKIAVVEAYLDCFVSKSLSQVRFAEDVTVSFRKGPGRTRLHRRPAGRRRRHYQRS